MATNKSNRIFYIKKDSTLFDQFKLTPVDIIKSNISIKIDNNIDTSDYKILVLSLVRNCNSSIFHIHNFIKGLNKYFKNINFCFFSNNNRDNTLEILKELENKYPTKISIIEYENQTINTLNRIHRLCFYRNYNFKHAIEKFGSDFDYVIVFDSDLTDDIPVEPIIDSLKITNVNWSCVSGNHCYKNSSYYYDELALRFLDDPIDIRKKFDEFDKYYGTSEHWLSKLFLVQNWIHVKSAFGGVSIYKMNELLNIYNQTGNLYDITDLPDFSAEHIALNLKLKNTILINPNIKYTNSIDIEGKMHYKPIAFVPRDAGFFSVFNFYIGCLSLGMRAYPYFNKQALLLMNNNVNEHFCYWTTNDNCWFDYFEPVSFFNNDTTHIDESYKNLPKHRGEIAPVEFRIPKDTYSLIQDKPRFQEWRNRIHEFYNTYIKYNPEIINRVNEFWENNIIQGGYVIGVHYRHPSHFIESGKIYLQQYFEKIDQLLLDNPNAQIFLATDSNFGIYAFKEKYGDKVLYISDIERLTMPEFLEWCFSLADGKADTVGFINGKGFELHHKRVDQTNNKKLTSDLLTEVLCLSKCNSLVHTTSNVALAISYINPDLELLSL